TAPAKRAHQPIPMLFVRAVHLQAHHPERALCPILYPVEPNSICGSDLSPVPIHNFAAADEKFLDSLELRDTKRRLKVGDAIVEPPLLVKISSLRTHRVVAQPPRALVELQVVGSQHAPFAGSDNLVSVK